MTSSYGPYMIFPKYPDAPDEDPREGLDPQELAEYEKAKVEYEENRDYEDMAEARSRH